MAGKRQLLLHRENAHAHSTFPLGGRIARKNESRLRQIHLLRQRLHLAVAESPRIRKYRERVAFQGRRREYIPLRHGQRACLVCHGETLKLIRKITDESHGSTMQKMIVRALVPVVGSKLKCPLFVAREMS